jgi:WD40 repeat protein
VRLFDVGDSALRVISRLSLPWAANYASAAPPGGPLGGAPLIAVVGDDPSTVVLDARSGLRVLTLQGHRDYSFAVAWQPGGCLLATGSQDATTRVWDVRATCTPLAVLGARMAAVRSLRFSPDGTHLAAAEPADFVHVYDVGAGFATEQVIDLFGEVAGVAFSPDGGALYVAVSDALFSSLLAYRRTPPVVS